MSEPSQSFLYDVFISYRHVEKDRRWAEWLISALEGCRIPKSLQAKGYPPRLKKVFRDEDEMPASGDLNDQIKQALLTSRFVIVICSPYTPRSKWVEREIEMFKELGRGDQVLALLTEGEPLDSFPAALLERARVIDKPDGTREIVKENTEPLAADVRPRKGVRDRILKEQALLRLVACILGVTYDTLRQRERERERQSWRRRAAVAAACISVILAGGVGYWEYTRPKVNYYSQLVWRWGLPEGLGQIDEGTRKHREVSYRVVTRMGRVEEAQAETSIGVIHRSPIERSPDVPDDSARWVVNFAADGTPTRIDHFDNFGRPIYQELLRRDANTMLVSFEKRGVPVSRTATSALFNDPSRTETFSSRSEITQHRLIFDPNGFIVERRYLDPWGQSREDGENSIGERTAYSPDGLPIRKSKLAADGTELVGKSGIVAARFDYDQNHQLVRQTFVGSDGRPVAGSEKFAALEYGRDKLGNVISKAYLGEDGQPTAGSGGIARLAIKLDDRGNELAIDYLDTKGALAMSRGGCARTVPKAISDASRERSCFAADGTPTVNSQGIHTVVWTFNERRLVTSRAFLGTDGKPVLTREGFSKIALIFDADGNEIENAVFGPDGRLTRANDGWARRLSKFDGQGNVIEDVWLDENGRPALTIQNGIARATYAYDVRGNRTEIALFGADGSPIVGRSGWARIRMQPDARGNQIRREFFGADGKPMTDRNGSVPVRCSGGS